MDKQKLIHQLFIGKVSDILGFEKTTQLLKEATNAINNEVPLSINQKVKRNYPESWDYWVSEIRGENILIRTTEYEDDPKYDDFWVNISELVI